MTAPLLLAVSPHLDDAAFSVGATLADAAAAGWRVVVATVFTGNVARPTGFALACQLDKGLDRHVDYMALRRAEDRRACAALGARHLHLPLLEAPHRGYDSAPALFAGVRPDDPALRRVPAVLAALLRRLRPARVLGPRGVGNHADHLIVRDALAALSAAEWWDDWPYAARTRAAAGGRLVAASAKAEAAKRAACLAYASQLGFQFGGAEGLLKALDGAREVLRSGPLAEGQPAH